MSVAPNFNHALVHREPTFKRGACLIFATKEEARQILDLLISLINRTGYATVYDLYLAIGIEATTEEDMIGWKDLGGALVKPTWNHKEFYLILPRLNVDHRGCDIRKLMT